MVERSNARCSLGPYFRFGITLDREKSGSNPAAGSHQIRNLAGRDGKLFFEAGSHRSIKIAWGDGKPRRRDSNSYFSCVCLGYHIIIHVHVHYLYKKSALLEIRSRGQKNEIIKIKALNFYYNYVPLDYWEDQIFLIGAHMFHQIITLLAFFFLFSKEEMDKFRVKQ
jgi:hypothetical protein